MRFIRHLIEQSMEKPEEIIAKERQRLAKVQDGADKLKQRWSTPMRPNGFWTFTSRTGTLRERVAIAETDPISPYASVAKEIAEQDQGAKQ